MDYPDSSCLILMARGAELSLGIPRVVSSVKLYQVAMICALGLAARLGARPLAPARPALDAAWFHRISGLSLDLLAVGALASLDFGGRALAHSLSLHCTVKLLWAVGCCC